ncbi:MAG: SDR family NAD(P)-dependent oxidoreductase [Candidatus Marinimicrobia bacterium]|nr:SDR family NAD(P)-dependent oxidoreductase [Candidatus Neomarinimicrobiota bacterium]MBT4715956.1 SDR family NAD(P)-dependent oxidoreductase [Candidatus Neomarinimicrobiota bacterium]MBT4948111.1 SDR family NAD(P)-dependent oxidoreductase [Candidatus Neomarinimicrobiota bacterium]MBT5270993.1 SDR family NAD(P)-dependent oxidoreductase [Candidatus Neomarinimicrobiota bacterium]MBT6012485.1 SDR family NAD(P)-dependent oxidoreductase [Candidatus Neomarinimicrobiota bacterium]
MTKWTTDNIPDQSGRIAIITGSNSGIGFEAAKALAEKGTEVILAVRSQAKGDAAMASILAELPNAKLQVRLLDLADLASVKSFAEQFNADFEHLDLLINNAGIMVPPYNKTVDGFESQFGTNHLGHFALTAQLYDLIKSTPDSRIVNVSSNAHKMGKLSFDDLAWDNRRYFPWKAYGDSKIANLYFTYELARKIQTANGTVMVTAAHPGLTASNLAKGAGVRFFNSIFAQSGSMGTLPTLMAATEPTAKTGNYFGPSKLAEWRGYPKLVSSNRLSHDADIAAKLWEISEELTGQKFQV